MHEVLTFSRIDTPPMPASPHPVFWWRSHTYARRIPSMELMGRDITDLFERAFHPDGRHGSRPSPDA
jgi:hypothetical protein